MNVLTVKDLEASRIEKLLGPQPNSLLCFQAGADWEFFVVGITTFFLGQILEAESLYPGVDHRGTTIVHFSHSQRVVGSLTFNFKTGRAVIEYNGISPGKDPVLSWCQNTY